MADETWSEVDHYLAGILIGHDSALTSVLESSAGMGLPPIEVSPTQGKLLMLLVKMLGAKRVLEIGTLGGYSTVWMARGLPKDGELISLESVQKHADIAHANAVRAGVIDRVTIQVGKALDSLAEFVASSAKPFDLVFLDADKSNNAKYLEWAMMLTHPGSVIVCDNVIWAGRVADESNEETAAVAARAFLSAVAADDRLEATAIQTVGVKGWDGFVIARVK